MTDRSAFPAHPGRTRPMTDIHLTDDPGGQSRTYVVDSREEAIEEAADARGRQRDWRFIENATALERRVLPWSVIPLPEEQSVEFVGGCTCDSPGGEFGHRPGCGYEPVPLPEDGEPNA